MKFSRLVALLPFVSRAAAIHPAVGIAAAVLPAVLQLIVDEPSLSPERKPGRRRRAAATNASTIRSLASELGVPEGLVMRTARVLGVNLPTESASIGTTDVARIRSRVSELVTFTEVPSDIDNDTPKLWSGICARCNDNVYATLAPLSFPVSCAKCRGPSLVLDGSNIAGWNASEFELETVVTLCLQLQRQRTDFVCVFDNSAWRKVGVKHGAQVQALFDTLLRQQSQRTQFVRTSDADPEVLRLANRYGARIISDDQFNRRDLRSRYPFLQDEGRRRKRVIRGIVCRGVLQFDALDIEAEIETDMIAALTRLLEGSR